ncbi:phage portal protein [Lactobacillus brevis] [Lactiplantibacillus mudanjiangensis]|uniref:phage portal protein n=1 Tax=Lactiplantibacillus mudanjiangensis TaxID=1296538 RepID=UPI001014C9A3|nr:phage portal protein [Lactiplantibacillus mudanjiangensis]VDG32873.1 phage portal protein [Lactobacillus brevis] [Lactiplantibacillus mudanjiangensis]
MAETNDFQAHSISLPWAQHNSLLMLSGDRFPFNANQDYQMPAEKWEASKNNSQEIAKVLQWFIKDHYSYQLPRILALERYYQGDNDIHYWRSDKANNRADNRIASGLPRYITNLRVGYQFGNPVKYAYTNPDNDADTGEDLTDIIEGFNSRNDIGYHEKVMGKNLNNTGRAFELVYIREGTNDAAIKAIDPANAFVVYDTTIENHSLFAVRYYMSTFMDRITYYVEVYTDSNVFYYTSENSPFGEYKFIKQVPHFFGKVPLSEYKLNDERLGAWEPKLDEIDAYDKSLSEMANSQEDFSNAILAISGDIDTGDDDEDDDEVSSADKVDLLKLILFLKPSIVSNPSGTNTVVPTDAKYITKALDATSWQTYVKQLLADVHKDTNTPDVSDENFASNATGVAMSYKLWGSDQERATQQSLYTRGLMRRLRLLAVYWFKISSIKTVDEVENVKISYTPNLPKNDSEIMTNIQALNSLNGSISQETIREQVEPVTGVPADQEKQRVDSQGETNTKDNLKYMIGLKGTDQDKADVLGTSAEPLTGGGTDDNKPS